MSNDVLSDEDAEVLFGLRKSGSLSPAEEREATRMLDKYYEFHTNPQTTPDLDPMAIAALGGDPQAAESAANALVFQTLQAQGLRSEDVGGGLDVLSSMATSARRLGVGTLKFGLMAADAYLEGSDYTGAQATIKSALNSVTDWYAQKQQEENQFFLEKFDRPSPNIIGELMVEGAPFFLFPVPSTFARAVGAATAEGGLGAGIIAAADAEALDEIVGEMQMGAMLSFGAGTVFNAVPGARAFASRQFNKQLEFENTKTRLQLEEKVREMTGDDSFSFSIGQLTAENPWLRGLEAGAAGRATLELQNARLKTLVDFIDQRAGRMDAEGILTDLSGTIVAAGRTRNEIARKRYGMVLEDIFTKYGDDLAMGRQNAKQYLSDLDDFIAELGDPRKINSMDPKALLRHRTFVRDRVTPFKVIRRTNKDGKSEWIVRDRRGIDEDQVFSGRGSNSKALGWANKQNNTLGGLTSEDIVEILKGHNELMSGTASAFAAATSGSSEHIGRRMMKSMMDAIDATDGAAIRDIRNAREAFAYEMEQVTTLKNSALGRLLGDDFVRNGTVDPDALLTQLITMGPTSMRNMREILETYAPHQVDELRATLMRKILQDSRDPTSPDVLSEVDISKFAEALSGRGNTSNVGRVGLGLFNASEQFHLINAAGALRTLMNTYNPKIVKDTAGLAQDATINVFSQSQEFMARFLARILSRGENVENLMINPSSRQALIDMAEEGVDSQLGRAAIATIASLVGHWEGEANIERLEQAAEDRHPAGNLF